MIRINLLPHREQKRKAQQIRFYVVAGASAALGAGREVGRVRVRRGGGVWSMGPLSVHT